MKNILIGIVICLFVASVFAGTILGPGPAPGSGDGISEGPEWTIHPSEDNSGIVLLFLQEMEFQMALVGD